MTAHQAHKVDVRHWYHGQKGGGFYTCFMGRNLSFMPDEVEAAKEMYKENCDIFEIAEVIMRPVFETGLLIASLADEGKLKPRASGVYAKENKPRDNNHPCAVVGG